MVSNDTPHWLKAMHNKMESIWNNKTFNLVPQDPSIKLVSMWWLFKIKYKANGLVDKFKAWWVAKGYWQLHGVDYDETYAPVVCVDHLWLLLAYATQLGLGAHQMDIITAFLQAPLQELKQAPLAWNQTINKHLHASSFQVPSSNPCIYIKGQGQDILIVSIYINDCLLITNKHNIPGLKHVLSDQFHMKDLGPVSSILWIEVLHNKKASTLCLQQKGHILRILKKYSMLNSAPNQTPLPISIQLKKIKATPDNCKRIPYHSAISKLLYIAIASRPDIAFTITYLCHFNNTYDSSHWSMVKHLLQYLKGTVDQAI